MNTRQGTGEVSPKEYDDTYYRDCLHENAPRLFKGSGSSEIELLYTTEQSTESGQSEVNKILINEEDVAIPNPALPKDHVQDLYHIIRQVNTWGRLLVTLNVFQSIISTYQVFSPYTNYLQAFGNRDTDEERSRNVYYWRKAQDSPFDEFCYNLKYIARNGRPQRNPWSIRQTGIYERYNTHTGQSVWIILQPSERAYRQLKEGIESQKHSTGGTGATSMVLHTDILIASGREWGQYLEDLGNQIQQLDKEAIYSSVGKSCEVDFSITFDERQKVQLCRSKLLKALHALDSDIKIVQGCEARHRYLEKIHGKKNPHANLQKLEWHLAELRAHRTATIRIMRHCTWTANLQEKILEYRNNEMMQNHSQALRDHASAQKSESENITRLARQTAQDSKMLKALTVMASLYLPASLLAVCTSVIANTLIRKTEIVVQTIFSSSLVHQETSNISENGGHLVVTQDFWKYIVIMLPMTATTALLVMWMRGRAAKMIC